MVSRRRLVTVLVVAAVASVAVGGRVASAEIHIRGTDVPTVFYISKSDDRNRVDYGIHLDERCRPVGTEPVFTYWRRFEPHQPRIGDLNDLDRQAYGIAAQQVLAGSRTTRVVLQIRALPQRTVTVVVREVEGRCEAFAQMTIGGRRARLDHVFVQLGGLFGVDHIEVRGASLETSAPAHERIRPR
jgi:hypothetical protein